MGSAEKVSRWWAVICALCGAPFFVALSDMGHPDKALVAFYSVFAIVLLAKMFWESRRAAWFWAFLTVLSILHGILVVVIQFSTTKHPAILVVGLFVFLDFIVSYFAFKFVEKRAGPAHD